ncbi:MAG: peptide chain release factor 1 [Hydrogenophilus sp.]|nr:peptide chain release factor 1 [Hydrogenophilus sp.]
MEIDARLFERLQAMADELAEIDRALADAAVAADPEQLRRLMTRRSELEEVVSTWERWQELKRELTAVESLVGSTDPELRALAIEERGRLSEEMTVCSERLLSALVPQDPLDARAVYLEVRAGTGGEEAALFAADLFRMYARYAERCGWEVEILSMSESERGGYKEIIAHVVGKGVYGRLKFESGGHRVQRVPITESQGRIHTSACTVAVLPEEEEEAVAAIDPREIRIDVFRASGAGGQHVNRTESAVRITHLPTGIVVECQEDRSQHRNKAKALAVLAARLAERRRAEQQAATAAVRRQLVGSGDRSDRIRTYNFPQGRVTDHRIDLTLYQLDEILDGNLDLLIQPLQRVARAEALAEYERGSGL